MKVIDIAKTYIGEKELPNNGGFHNPELQEIMTKAGHKKGEAWCAYFAEAMFVKSADGDEEKVAKLRGLFSGSAVQTWKNFVKGKAFTVTQTPTPGALVLFQKFVNKVPTWQGHAAIVVGMRPDGNFQTIEGNTNSTGSREGDSVQLKVRSLKLPDTGLRVLGFVIIPE
jgi:hypothetical protein